MSWVCSLTPAPDAVPRVTLERYESRAWALQFLRRELEEIGLEPEQVEATLAALDRTTGVWVAAPGGEYVLTLSEVPS